MFSLVSRAYETLKDPAQRGAYDLLRGITSNSKDELRRVTDIQKDDARAALQMMRITFDLKLRAEMARKGLVIDIAVYGTPDGICDYLKHIDSGKDSPPPDGPCMNVTRQLQCVVNNSRLCIPKGDPKHVLEAFYDPAIGENKNMLVRYFFRGRLHQAIVGDEDKLLLPLKSHLIKRGTGTAAPSRDKFVPRTPRVKRDKFSAWARDADCSNVTYRHGSALGPKFLPRLALASSSVAVVVGACAYFWAGEQSGGKWLGGLLGQASAAARGSVDWVAATTGRQAVGALRRRASGPSL